MKKILLSGFLILTFAIYGLRGKISSGDENHIAIPKKLSSTSPISSSSSNLPNPAFSSSTSPPSTYQPTPKGQYKDGQYTGASTDAYYGNVQVKAVISSGKITDVQFLDYPHDRQTSQEINAQAMPYLTQEAIQAQGAQVDIVSGATATSQAFVESLNSALSQAK